MEAVDSSPIKKHKKHKHKKHKKKKSHENEIEGSIDNISMDDQISTAKIKMQHSSIERVKVQTQSPKMLVEKSVISPSNSFAKPAPAKKKKRGRDSGTSSEEERWLDAIESGKLEDVDDELKKIKPKDPKLMTARQRAMYERGNDKEASPGGEALMSLPTGYKEKVMTAEAIQKAALKSQKRKQLADEKREKDKKRTMDRLLKKQETKQTKSTRIKLIKPSMPVVTYKHSVDGITLSYPPNVDYPLENKTAPPIPAPKFCGVQGCKNLKKYTCSRTNVPLCSLKCYKQNIVQILS